MYLLTVPLWIPNSLAIPLMDSPLRFACCTAFHLYYDGSRGGFYSQQAGKGIFTGAMTRLYGWIALGVVTTGAVGWLSHQAGIQESILENFGMIGYFVVLGVWLACIFGLSFLASGVSPAVAGAGYLVFTAITGLMISTILWACTGDTIIMAFALTTVVFSVMSVIGCTTKRDLSGLGTLCMTGLFGIIIAGVVNWFIGSNMLSWIITLVALPIFLGLTVYQTKQMKELAQEAAMRGDERAATQVAIMGAVGLYVTFLNIFLILLRILDIFGGE